MKHWVILGLFLVSSGLFIMLPSLPDDRVAVHLGPGRRGLDAAAGPVAAAANAAGVAGGGRGGTGGDGGARRQLSIPFEGPGAN